MRLRGGGKKADRDTEGRELPGETESDGQMCNRGCFFGRLGRRDISLSLCGDDNFRVFP